MKLTIRTDSRKIQPGDTFVALRGISSNGADYIGDAIAAGAARIVCETGLSLSYPDPGVEFIQVEEPERYLKDVLHREYGAILARMKLFAVTGTNGKTTVCWFIYQSMNRLGFKCAYLGTVGFFLEERVRSLPNTTVDLCSTYELLLEAWELGF